MRLLRLRLHLKIRSHVVDRLCRVLREGAATSSSLFGSDGSTSTSSIFARLVRVEIFLLELVVLKMIPTIPFFSQSLQVILKPFNLGQNSVAVFEQSGLVNFRATYKVS